MAVLAMTAASKPWNAINTLITTVLQKSGAIKQGFVPHNSSNLLEFDLGRNKSSLFASIRTVILSTGLRSRMVVDH